MIICTNSNGITIRVAFGNKNNKPINISKTANKLKSIEKYIEPTVPAINACASGLAGLMPINLMIPNQKNIRNREKRATGKNDFLKNLISFRSNDSTAFFLLPTVDQYQSFSTAIRTSR